MTPKDFDLLPPARRPSMVSAILCRTRQGYIGRRLNWSMCIPREIIEVATFRASHADGRPRLKHRWDGSKILVRAKSGSAACVKRLGQALKTMPQRSPTFLSIALFTMSAAGHISDYATGMHDYPASCQIRCMADPAAR